MPNLEWRIYYDGGGTYAGPPELAPFFGVLVIVARDKEHGRRLISGGDFFIWHIQDQTWYSVDDIGLVDYLQQPGWKRVLAGRKVRNSAWYEACALALGDEDFPSKTGWRPDENRP